MVGVADGVLEGVNGGVSEGVCVGVGVQVCDGVCVSVGFGLGMVKVFDANTMYPEFFMKYVNGAGLPGLYVINVACDGDVVCTAHKDELYVLINVDTS